VSRRGVLGGGSVTDRGTEFDGVQEIYIGGGQDHFHEQNLVARGVSSFLILSKRGQRTVDEQESTPPTKVYTFDVKADTGKRYAAGSGDYNPWHVSVILAKMFGFKTAIVQGFFSLSKSISLMKDSIPKYPLKMEVEWRKPIFLPCKNLTLKEFLSADKNTLKFEVSSSNGEHLHLRGTVTHDPKLKLQKAVFVD